MAELVSGGRDGSAKRVVSLRIWRSVTPAIGQTTKQSEGRAAIAYVENV